MNIAELLEVGLGIKCSIEAEVTGITADSREVLPGNIFVSISCVNSNIYQEQAKLNGAIVLVVEDKHIVKDFVSEQKNVFPFVCFVKDARLALAKLCAVFYSPVPKFLAGVTGTNGKSSVVSFVSQILNKLNILSADIGTLGVNASGSQCVLNLSHPVPPLTTFDAVSLHKILSNLNEEKVKCAAIEITSHGLQQNRVSGLRFNAIGLTNITQDHLDYHGSLEEYASVKSKIMDLIVTPNSVEGSIAGSVILNKNSAFFENFYEVALQKGLNILVYQCMTDINLDKGENVSIFAENIRTSDNGSIFDLSVLGERFEDITLSVFGSFQVENLLCAVGLVLVLLKYVVKESFVNLGLKDIISVIPLLEAVDGRLELVAEHNGGKIYVDFGHTPDALERVLADLRKQSPSRLMVLFGCGGERDKGKRPKMGAIAEKLADCIIITDDNSRSEDPAQIRKQILSGAPSAKEIAQRQQAIIQAIADISKDDILLIAGRGHEMIQKIEGKEIEFNDKAFVKSVVSGCLL